MFRLWSIVLACCFSVCSVARSDEIDHMSALLKEAPAQWGEYIERDLYHQGEFVLKKEEDGKDVLRTTINERKNKHCYASTRVEVRGGRQEMMCNVVGRLYSFELRRETASDNWSIKGFQPASEAKASDLARTMQSISRKSAPLVALYSGQSLPELFQRPEFEIISVTEVKRNQEKLVRLEFDNTHTVLPLDTPNAAKEFYPIQSGTLVLAPHQYWTLRECELHCLHPPMKKGEKPVRDVRHSRVIQVRDPKAAYPLCDKITDVNHIVDVEGNHHTETLTSVSSAKLLTTLPPDSEFTLTAFGLAEISPDWKKADTGSTQSWLIAIAVVLLIIAVVFGVYLRRSKAAH